MAELKTKPTTVSLDDFLNRIADKKTRAECFILARMMKQATKSKPTIWGTSIVGFGRYHFKYASGREGDWPLVGFSPRKRSLTVYLMGGFAKRHKALLKGLGKHKTSSACLYLNSLADVDLAILKKLIDQSVAEMVKANSRAG